MPDTYTIQLAPCGTLSAYRRHRRRGEDCSTCRDAWAAYYRDRARQQRTTPDGDS